jgi:hypothetical protein
MGGNSNNILMFGNNFIGDIDKNVQPLFENNNQNNKDEVKSQ